MYKKEIPDLIYRLSAASVVMSGHMMTNDDQRGPAVKIRVLLKREIYDFFREEGLDASVVINKLLENFMLAYKAFWENFACAGRDLNPGQGLGNAENTAILTEILNYKMVREDFVEWISSQVSQDHAKKVISYLDRYLDKPITTPQELFNLVNNLDKGKRHLIIALRNLLKYLETFDLMSEETANKFRKVLKIPQTGVDDRVPSNDDILELYRKITDERYKLFFKLKIYSGLRNNEVVKLLNNFDSSKVIVEGKVARYPMVWIRPTKKTYFAFFPAKFLEELKRVEITEDGVSHYFSERGIPAKFLRKWNFTFLVENGVPYQIANFIQGRAPIDVSMMHYLDTVKVATEQYAKVVDKFPV